MKLADGVDFQMGMKLYYNSTGLRFPIEFQTNESRHVLVSDGLAVIPQATSSEGVVGTTIPLDRFHSTLESALNALLADIDKDSHDVGVEEDALTAQMRELHTKMAALKDRRFGHGYLRYKLGMISSGLEKGMTFDQAQAAYSEALESKLGSATQEPIQTQLPTQIGFHTTCATSCTTPKKRREPKPTAKSVAEIMG